MSNKKKKVSKSSKDPGRMLCWFEIPADDTARAKKFYYSLFGWKINAMPGAIADYWHLDTGGADASPDAGLMGRKCPEQTITNYISVPSVTRFAAKVEKLGGKIVKPKTGVPGMGYFAICVDTEHNVFGLWDLNPKAK